MVESSTAGNDSSAVRLHQLCFLQNFLWLAQEEVPLPVQEVLLPVQEKEQGEVLLVVQSEELLLTIDRQRLELTVLLHLHPLLTVLHDPLGSDSPAVDELGGGRDGCTVMSCVVPSTRVI